jgi:Uri superfamily endonuclease
MIDSGCYQLKIKIISNISIDIGALGLCSLKKGDYVYTGSAMKNLRHRIERHKRKDKKIHWHIDYLLANPLVQLIDVIIHPSEFKEECKFNQLLISKGAEVPVKGFGSSDCKVCQSHFVRIDNIILP